MSVEGSTERRTETEGDEQEDPDLKKLQELGLEIGTRLEVMWDVEDSNTHELTSHWWGCKLVQGEGAKMYDSDRRRVWKILYDAKIDIDESFKDENALVTFVDTCELFDMERELSLQWRIEGKEVNIPVLTMNDILQSQAQIESEEGAAEGESVEQHAVNALNTLPMDAQQRLVAGYRDFADNMKARLAEIQQREGEGYAITANDVTSIVDALKKRS